MNVNNPPSKRLFRDRPLSDLHFAPPACLSLHEACREPSDRVDAVLRVFLVLCMLTALLICGWNVNVWQNANANPSRPAVAAERFCVSNQRTF